MDFQPREESVDHCRGVAGSCAGRWIMAFPLYWMFVTTIVPREEAYSRELHLIPQTIVFDNYINGWTSNPWPRWYGNTLIIVGTSVFGLTIFSLLAVS
ncbi:MAG: hypothetical protein R2851_05460 [Caldilineaceae bacterium]